MFMCQNFGRSLRAVYGYSQILHCSSAPVLSLQKLVCIKKIKFIPSANFYTSIIKRCEYPPGEDPFYDKRHYSYNPGNRMYYVIHEDNPEMPVVNFTITLRDQKTKVNFKAHVGNTIMKAIQKHNEEHDYEIPMECACGGVKACTTCHVYCEEGRSDIFTKVDVYEDDLLDSAKNIKPTSRLSCQMKILKEFDHMELVMPISTVNFDVDKTYQQQLRQSESASN